MKIHCLQHLKYETLGNIGTWVTLIGHSLTKTLPVKNLLFLIPQNLICF